jgi:hypothetical protein
MPIDRRWVLVGALALGSAAVPHKSDLVPSSDLAFLEPTEAGFRVRPIEGGSWRALSGRDLERVLWVTPDLTGAITLSVTGAPGEPQIRLIMRGIKRNRALEFGDAVSKVEWTAADGRSALVLRDHQIEEVADCGHGFRSRLVVQDVQDFALTVSHTAWIPTGATGQLRWRRRNNGETRTLSLHADYDTVLPSYLADAVIVVRRVPGNPDRLASFALVDLSTGSKRDLPDPHVWVVGAAASRSRPVLVLEGWDGSKANAEGIPLTAFYVWRYEEARSPQKLLDNPHSIRVFETPTNIVPLPTLCGEP